MRLKYIGLLALVAQSSIAQSPDSAQRTRGAMVTGIVRDSIARAPLAGATVQLVVAEPQAHVGHTTVSDEGGRFTLRDVPDGRYRIGFYHPLLDSLGVEAPVREVEVSNQRSVRADLAVPSAARLRSAFCGERRASAPGGVIVGVLRDWRDGTPVARATVRAEWLEVTLSKEGSVRSVPHLEVATQSNGWFALCDVPSGGSVTLSANRGADSTDRFEVQIPREGLLRQELALGPAQTTVARDSVKRDSQPTPVRPVRSGAGRLLGTVVGADGIPLPGALLSISDGPRIRANEHGEFTIANLPTGTRVLETRAIGHSPDRRAVNIVSDGQPVVVVLPTIRAVLDTIKVTASRNNARNIAAFEMRVRSGAGKYITAADIARRQPHLVLDLFQNLPGVTVQGGALTGKTIKVRGLRAEWCIPAIFLNGAHLRGVTGDDLELWVQPAEIAGIEVYAGTGAPVDVQQSMIDEYAGCGTIMIWTK